MDEKSKEVLETPQVHLFKHENVFGNSFKDEITKAPDFLRLNSTASTAIDSPSVQSNMSTLNSANSINFLPSTNSASFLTTSNSSFNNSAPKKNLLFRTISQSDQPIELQRQDSVKMIDSLNASSGYYSSQNSSTNSIFTPESTSDQIISTIMSGTNKQPNTNNLKLLSEMSSVANNSSPNRLPSTDQQNGSEQSNSLKRKSMDVKITDDFKLNTPMVFQAVNNQSTEKDAKFISKIESNILPNNTHKKMNGHGTVYQDIQRTNGNKIISLIQNEMFYNEASSTKTNGFGSPNDLNSKSRSSSSSNDDIVTSSDQNIVSKMKPKRSIMLNTDVRKQQIRNSNREAARRCRERRRNYIETLEANIRTLETEKKNLVNENNSLKCEVGQLKKTISDHKSFCSLDTNHSSNISSAVSEQNKQNNNFRLVNNNENGTSIAGVPVVLTLNLPNLDIESGHNNSTNDNSNKSNVNNITISNQQVLQKLLSALVTSSKTNNSPTTNPIEIQSHQQSLN